MAFIDDRGRVFGRFNLIDLMVGVFVLVLVPIAYGAYALFRPAPPTITTIEPKVLLPGKGDQRIKITGTNFRPYLTAALGDSRAFTLLIESIGPSKVDIP